jgi:hypothetical protein
VDLVGHGFQGLGPAGVQQVAQRASRHGIGMYWRLPGSTT